MSIVAALLLLTPVFDVRTFGAKGDGKTMDTAAVQAALDAAARKGGRVTLANGRFLCGTLDLRSGVELRIEKGAALLGSTSRDDYRRNNRWYALLLAHGARGIAVTGGGTIDGQGRALASDVVRRWRAGACDRRAATG